MEYAILAAFVAIMVVLILKQSGDALSGIWDTAANYLSEGKTAAQAGSGNQRGANAPPAAGAASSAPSEATGASSGATGVPKGKAKGGG